MKKTLVISILVAVLLIAGCSSKTSQELTATQPPEGSAASNANIIEITDAGYTPEKITIKKDGSVTFVNKGAAESWPASAVHPTHQVYPGSDIKKCNTPEQSSIFDACRGLQQGESWSFIFNEQGNWKYHDHLHPALRGEIVVV